MSIVIDRVDQIEIYENNGNKIMIRQTYSDGEEAIVCFPKSCIQKIISALAELGGDEE